MNEEEIGIVVTLTLYLFTIPYAFYQAHKEQRLQKIKVQSKFIKFAKINTIFIISILGVFAIITHTNYLDYERPIEYSGYDSITFKNFRGLELFKKTLYNNPHFAYVVTAIEYKIDDDSITVKSLFHPSRSYVYNQTTNSKELLQHEKYHFKITELFARKIKYQIATRKYPNKSSIEKLIRKNLDEERQFQRKYDDETFHSYVLSEQKKYENKIDSLLDLLSVYQPSKIPYELP
jgi:hypothetical protein